MAWLLVSCSLLAGAGLVAPACSSDDSRQTVPESGKITLDLTATDASGALYRLRNGIFENTAFSTDVTVVVSSEDDPNAERMDIELPADGYSVFLLPGYYLERVDGGAGGEGGEGGTTSVASVSGGPITTGGSVTTGSGGSGGDYAAAAPQFKRLADLVKFRAENPKRKGVVAPRVAATARAEITTIVDAELVSENPAFAQVSANQTTDVDFVFSLEPGAGGHGDLSIGIDVIGSGSTDCEADEYEPNNSPEQAPLVSLDPAISATACSGDEDYYLFEPPVAEGETFHVVLDFVHAQGDIDCALVDNEGNIVDFSAGVDDQEELIGVSNGQQYMLYAYPYDGEAPYTAHAEPFEIVLSNCCSTSEFPTCTDPEVNSCVCELDPWCCEVNFDSLCVQEALGQCGGTCPAGEGSCCEAQAGPGCEDTDVLTCICALDSQCCSSNYDEVCAQEAIASCGASCDFPAPDSDCCSPGENPSCTDSEVADCTCDIDPFCCAHPFDENCVAIAAGFCGAECGGT